MNITKKNEMIKEHDALLKELGKRAYAFLVPALEIWNIAYRMLQINYEVSQFEKGKPHVVETASEPVSKKD